MMPGRYCVQSPQNKMCENLNDIIVPNSIDRRYCWFSSLVIKGRSVPALCQMKAELYDCPYDMQEGLKCV